MATRLYLTNTSAQYTPATFKGAWDATDESTTNTLDPDKTYGGAHTSKTDTKGATSGTHDACIYRGVSGPLAAQSISGGTFSVLCGIDTSSTAADMRWHVHVYVTQGDSDSVRGTLLSDYVESLVTFEWPATDAVKALGGGARSLSTVSAQAGDRIVVELGYATDVTGTGYVGKIWYGTQHSTTKAVLTDATLDTNPTTTQQAHYVEFSQTLSWDTTESARVTQVVLESLQQSSTADVRVPQLALEVLTNPSFNQARVAQIALEVLQATPTASPPSHTNPARVTQIVAEGIVSGTSAVRVTQLAAESIIQTDRAAKMTQLVVEVIGSYFNEVAPTPPPSALTLFIDGGDHYTTVSQKWTSTSGVTTGPAKDGDGLLFTSGGYVERVVEPPVPTIGCFGCSYLCQSGTLFAWSVRYGTTEHLVLKQTPSGNLTLESNGVVLGSTSFALVPGLWYFVELSWIIGATGSAVVRINGAAVLTINSASILGGTTGRWDRVRMASESGTPSVDNVYIRGTTILLGPVVITVHTPILAYNTEWTPSAGTDHPSLVDENTAPDLSDYLTAPTAGSRETFLMSPVTGIVTIKGVQMVAFMGRDGSGYGEVKPLCRPGVEHVGVGAPITDDKYSLFTYDTNPDTGVEWTSPEFGATFWGLMRSV